MSEGGKFNYLLFDCFPILVTTYSTFEMSWLQPCSTKDNFVNWDIRMEIVEKGRMFVLLMVIQ